MCIIFGADLARRVHVSRTNLFGRLVGDGSQVLVYQMKVEPVDGMPIAMVLPLPVAKRSEDALAWVNLKNYSEFFTDLNRLFPVGAFIVNFSAVAARGPAELKVHNVGDYIASFVPSIHHFDSLSSRFNLPRAVVEAFPDYANYGFAVFQLKITRVWRSDSDGNPMSEIQPMAFRFLTAQPDKIFFPTVHFHGGELQAYEDFDHSFFWQGENRQPIRHAWQSDDTTDTYIDVTRVRGLVMPDAQCWRLRVVGEQPNKDTWIDAGPAVKKAPSRR